MERWKQEAKGILDEFARRGARFVEPTDIPEEIRARLDAICMESVGRMVMEVELEEFLSSLG